MTVDKFGRHISKKTIANHLEKHFVKINKSYMESDLGKKLGEKMTNELVLVKNMIPNEVHKAVGLLKKELNDTIKNMVDNDKSQQLEEKVTLSAQQLSDLKQKVDKFEQWFITEMQLLIRRVMTLEGKL